MEDAIRKDFLPSFTGRAVGDAERDLLCLPAGIGGLGLPIPAKRSIFIASHMTKLLLDHLLQHSEHAAHILLRTFVESRRLTTARLKQLSTAAKLNQPPLLQRAANIEDCTQSDSCTQVRACTALCVSVRT